MSFLPTCGHCGPCASGRAALCAPGHAANAAGTLLSGTLLSGALLSGARRITCEGVAVNHHSGVCAFSEHAVIHRRSIVKVNCDLPFEHAVLFGCGVMTGVGAALNTCGIVPGQSVAVVGLGGVGLSSVLGAVGQPRGRDRPGGRQARPRTRAGRHRHTLGGGEETVPAVRDVTGGGVDHAIERAGAAKAFELAFAVTRPGGTTTTAGLARPGTNFALPAVALVGEERRVQGCYMGSCVPSRDIPRFIAMFCQGRLPVDRLLSGTGPLDGINAASDRLDRGEVVHHVILM